MLIIGAIFRRGLLLVTFLSRPLLFILTFRRGLLLLRGIGTFFTFLLRLLVILATFPRGLLLVIFLRLLRLLLFMRVTFLRLLLLVTFPSIFLVFASILFALILETLSDDKHSVHRKGAGEQQDTAVNRRQLQSTNPAIVYETHELFCEATN